MVEPIRRVLGPRSAVDGPAPVHGLTPVARDDRKDELRKRRRPPKKAPEQGGVHRDDDGHVHVDVRA